MVAFLFYFLIKPNFVAASISRIKIMKLSISNRRFAAAFQWLLAVMFLLGLQATAAAQTTIDDPLKKPEIWKKLMANPTDTTLWTKYCGKPRSKMSIKQLEEVNTWKQELMLRQLADEEAVIGLNLPTDQSDMFIDDVAFEEIMKQISDAKAGKGKNGQKKLGADGKPLRVTHQELLGMEAIILQEQSELAELKTNIHANFAMIEEYYKEIFAEFKLKYVYYIEQYPNKKYSEVKWVEDQEKKLKQEKARQIQELRKKFVVASGN
jgi:hypothetical protein